MKVAINVFYKRPIKSHECTFCSFGISYTYTPSVKNTQSKVLYLEFSQSEDYTKFVGVTKTKLYKVMQWSWFLLF